MGAKNYGENFWIFDYVFGTLKDYSAIHVVSETNAANNEDKNYSINNNENIVVKNATDKQVDNDNNNKNNNTNNNNNNNNEEVDIVKPRQRGRPSSKSPSKRK